MTADFLYMKANQEFEAECHEQAKAEIGLTPSSGIEQIHKVLLRAQEIKRAAPCVGCGMRQDAAIHQHSYTFAYHDFVPPILSKRKGPLTVDEVLEKTYAR